MTDRKILLIEYFITEDAALLFGLRPDWEAPRLIQKPLDQRDLRIFVESNFGARNRVRGLRHLLSNWHSYDFLVSPIAEWAEPNDIVYLIPHGWLHYLPLHALKIEGQYVIERNPIVYCPSASIIKYCQSKRRGSRISPDATRKPPPAAIFGDSRENLRFARHEAESVAALFGVDSILGGQVTEQTFVEAILGVDVVHFAGHGEFVAGQPLESGLQLAGGGKLTARDVFNLKGLEADLVTLSGCETGISEHHPGDELIGLTRAFLYAGTPSLIVSLWRVADESTSFLMNTFYRLWRATPEISKVDALQQAMIQTMRQPGWEFFYHWAPFTLIGDWR